MAKRRLVTSGAGLRPVERQPAVRVRDDFNAGAARTASSDLQAIAAGLGQIAPRLAHLAGQLQDEHIEESMSAGAARFAELAQEQDDFASAMRQGLIEAKDNPFFRQGLMEAAGVVAADRYGDELRMGSGSLEDRTDMAAFDEMQQAAYEAATAAFGPEGKNEAFNRAFQNRAMGHTTSARQRFANGVSSAMLEDRGDVLYEEVSSSLATAMAEGLEPAQMAEVVTRIADAAYGQGLKGSLVNEIVSTAIVDHAITLAETDPYAASRLLDMATEVRSGPGEGDGRPRLFDTRQGRRALNAARRQVRIIQQEVANQKRFQETEERRLEGIAVRTEAMEAYFEAEDVDDVNIEPLIYRATLIGDERLVGELQQIRENFRSARWYTDQEKLAQAQIEIWEPGSNFGTTQVSAMLARKDVTVADARALNQEIAARDRYLSASAGENPLNDPFFKQYTDGDFTREFRDKFGFQGGELGKRANLAMNDFRAHYLRLVESGEWGGMTLQQRNDTLQDLFRMYIEIRGGGRSTIETINEAGSSAPRASIHDVTADWREVIVLTRAEITRINEAEKFSDLSRSDQELIWQLTTRNEWQEFKTAQNRLLLNLSEGQQENEEE